MEQREDGMACSPSRSHPLFFFFYCSRTKQPPKHENRYGRPCESLCRYFSMPSPGVKLSPPSIMRPTTVASLWMHCLLAISLSTPEASSLACERDLITAEVYHMLWYTLIVILTLQYVVNLRDQRQFFVSAVSSLTIAGALTGSSSN